MKHKLPGIVLVIMMLLTNCSPTSPPAPLQEDTFTFTIEFYPSFDQDCLITVRKENGKAEIMLENIWYGQDSTEITDRENVRIIEADSLAIGIINNSKYRKKTYLERVERAIIPDSVFKSFVSQLEGKVNLATQDNLLKEGMLDGIAIIYRFKSDEIDHVFGARSPSFSDTVHFQLVESVFYLVENSFTMDLTSMYIDELGNYIEGRPVEPQDSSSVETTLDTLKPAYQPPLAAIIEELAFLPSEYVLKNFSRSSFDYTRLGSQLIKAVEGGSMFISDLQIEEIRSRILTSFHATFKGAVPMYKSKTGATYPRAVIEEFIFVDEESAESALNVFLALKSDPRGQYVISKEPSYFVKNGNKLYFILTGGTYMVDMGLEIKEVVEAYL